MLTSEGEIFAENERVQPTQSGKLWTIENTILIALKGQNMNSPGFDVSSAER